MRLLIGWCLRSVFLCALLGFVVVFMLTIGSGAWDWGLYFVIVGVSSTLMVLYFIADYLVDYEDWQKKAGK